MVENECPLVSFVVPCYNYGRYLPECLSNIFQLKGDYPFEVAAVDDASTDNTQEVLRSFADRRLRVITHTVNHGHVDTVNEGLAAARGKYVARIDPDDRYRPNFLAALLPVLERSPRVGMVYGDAAMIDADGRVTWPRCAQPHGGRPFSGPALV